MRTVYAAQLALRSREGKPAPEVFKDVCGRVRQWIEGKYARAWAAKIAVPEGTGVLNPLSNHQIAVQAHTLKDVELNSVEWRHPHDTDALSSWLVSLTVARHQDHLHFAMQLRIISQATIIRPIGFELGRPRIVTELVKSFSASIGAWPVPYAAERVLPPDVDNFVAKVLLSKQRTIPVLLISPDPNTEKPLVDPIPLQEELLGLAQVLKLENKYATFRLTDAVGKERSCFNGAARLYWPGFTTDANPFDHWLFLPENLRNREADGVPLQKQLFRMLVGINVFRFQEGPVIAAAKKALADEEKSKVEELREEVRQGSLDKEQLKAQLLKSYDDMDMLKLEIEQMKEDVDKQKASCAECQRYMRSERDESESSDAASSVAIQNLAEVVSNVKQQFPSQFVFLPQAEKQATESPFSAPELTMGLFEALAELVGKWRESASIGSTWKDFLVNKGFSYKADISSACRQKKIIGEYQGTYDGKKRTFGEHVTFGKGQAPQKCMSVHWWRDETKKLLVIGRCGKHGTNTLT